MGLGHSPAVVSEGLVFYFDPINTRSYAGTGLTGFNLIDTSINGSFLNGPVYDAANKGSIYFDGVDDYIDFGSSTIFKLLDNFTLSVWVKSSVYGDRAILGNFGPSTDYSGFNLNIQPSNKFAFLTGSAATATYLYSNDTFALNTWYHLTAVRQNGTNYLYVNGVGQSSTNSQVVKYSNQNFYFAKWYSNLTGFYHNGNIASAAFYNKALSSTEILQNYNATKKRFSPEENIVRNGLVLYYDAGNPSSYAGTGNTAFSVAGIGYTATLVNGPTFTSTSGGGFVFDGTNDYINIPTTTGLDSTSVSWSFWYRSSSDTAQALISKGSSTFFKLTVGPSTVTLTNELITIIGEDNGNRVGYISTNRNELFDNNWHNIVFTAQPSFYKLYLDGRDLSLTVGLGNNNGSITNAGSSFFIGTNSTSEYVNGNISHVQIYNRALSAQEISQNFNAARDRYGI